LNRIILASQSPRRSQLLRQINLTFEVIPSSINEEENGQTDPARLVEELAQHKAEDVAMKIFGAGAASGSSPGSGTPPATSTAFQPQPADTLIIGADTTVVLDNQILGKPADPADARRLLRLLSGRTHIVYTGVSLVLLKAGQDTPVVRTFHEQTRVTFSPLTDAEIAAYVAGGSPMDKAGAYGIQDDLGALFVEHIDGDYYNVVGFPLNRFYRELKSLGWSWDWE
jgi:septum formation protein